MIRPRWIALAALGVMGCTEPFDVAEYEVPAAAAPENARVACADRAPLRKALFGDLHVHTAHSSDARGYDVTVTPDQAYRYAFGESIGLPPLDADGQPTRRVRIDRPLDFAAVTDHAEFLGENTLCYEPSEAYDSDSCKEIRAGTNPQNSPLAMFIMLPAPWRNNDICGADNARCKAARASAWEDIIRAAETWNDATPACERTTFIAYEYSSFRMGSNLHRNVIFRNSAVPAAPISYIETQREWELWRLLQQTCNDSSTGCDSLAIPHNSNISNGRMFSIDYPGTLSIEDQAERARLRVAIEPIVEMMQHKGDSECRALVPGVLGEPDELCAFEKFEEFNFKRRGGVDACYEGAFADSVPHLGPDCISPRSYVRYALTEGLREEARIGVNPFKFGLMASTDTHNGLAGGVDERSWPGHLGIADASLADRASLDPAVYGNNSNGPGGLIGVWAEQNSRDSIFDAMERKEVFGTSGPRIRPRFFGGWNLPDDLCDGADAVARADAAGVPMGRDLPAATDDAPSFLALAHRDPARTGGQLERIQIIKGWVDDDGEMNQRVYDVAGSAGGEASVDLATCRPRGKGFDSLCSVWRDPDFEASRRAVYYARVIENPSCRYNQWQCVTAGADAPAECDSPYLVRTIQERAWTSPIWYTPWRTTTESRP
jgi:hypothetical protein